MALAPGTRLGPYEIVAPLGAGGMGEVYRAIDTKLGREVALKVLPAEMAHDPERLSRFRREARALAQLDHPNIVTIHSVEETDGVHFLTMQLVEGQPLDRLIPAGGLPLEQIVEIASALGDALAAAHEKGIVHRDLKPANVMVSNQGRVKVLDFGLAKDVGRANFGDATQTSTGQTQVGVVMGTPAYMSPEQLSGRPLDHRSDIFSLGVVLHEMATGQRPFDGKSPAELVSAILRDAPSPVSDVRPDLPNDLARIIQRCLEKDPGRRVQTARDVSNEFRDLARLDASSEAVAGEKPGVGTPAVWRRPALAALAILLLGSVVYLVMHSGVLHRASGAPEAAINPPGIRSIAVLPLDNYSGDPSQDYFAEGMTDELTTDLANISQLRVISRGSVMQFKGEHRPPTPEIAKTLNVDAVVEGSVLRDGDKVRITAQLIDARVDKHLWAKSFERNSRDVLALQDELAMAIASEIHVQLTPTEQSRLTTAPVVDPEAHDAYLKGRYFFNRPSDENLKKAIAQFEEAVRLNPQFALAFSGLSDAYLWAGYNEGVLTAAEARPKAKAAAEKAIQLDDASAEAHASLATFKLFYEYDWAGCESEFRRAFALNPNYAFARDQFGLALAFQGRLEESLSEGKIASELDPLSPQIPIDNIFAYAWQGKYQGAREQTKRAADLDPAYFFPQMAYGWIDIEAGKIRDAIPELQKAKTMDPPAFVSAFLGYAYAASGDRARAMAEMEDLKKTSLHGHVLPFNLALVYTGLGDHERALDCLEQAYATDSQWMGWLKNDRIFDSLRSEPRFVALMRKLRFEN